MHSISSNCQTRNRLVYRILIGLVPAQQYSGFSLRISVCRDFSSIIYAWIGSREIQVLFQQSEVIRSMPFLLALCYFKAKYGDSHT